jgi:carbon-monoxide dehydrogenase large subunit
MHLGGLAGTYTTPAIYVEVSAVFTNTTSIGPYRGSGRPEASYILERLIDTGGSRDGHRPRRIAPPQHGAG